MNSLTSAQYSLVKDDLVVARVKAFNVIGDGSYTSNTIGVTVWTVPLAPDNTPTVVVS